ncbi:unnamed protein product [marine sediment metagenome]|uniref:Uncharacterized protein n=1 Tax=marine sediment metagenome TaxID=412755 RepID=X1AKS3_9ZZZZ
MMKILKVAHFGNFAPNSCGLFHTTKDTVLAERSVGIDSQFIDWGYAKEYSQQYSRVGLSYEGVTTIAPQWAIDKADILVLHSALPKFVKDCGKPIVSAIHGRPEYSFDCERLKKGATLNLYHNFSKDPQPLRKQQLNLRLQHQHQAWQKGPIYQTQLEHSKQKSAGLVIILMGVAGLHKLELLLQGDSRLNWLLFTLPIYENP